MSLISLDTVPHPDGWLKHTPRPDMKGKRLGILAHTWFKPDQGARLEPIFGTITDIAVEEPTCLALDANKSLQDPLHNMMYEEWEDYDEFFQTQLTRRYRMAFMRWLIPVMSAPIAAEFYEVLDRMGDFEAGQATVVLSFKSDAKQDAAAPAKGYVAKITADADCVGACAMQSLNDPSHFVVVERWTRDADIGCNLDDHPIRAAFAETVAGISVSGRLCAETFRVHHNPGRFEMAA